MKLLKVLSLVGIMIASTNLYAGNPQKLSIQGMVCSGCASKVEKAFLDTGKVKSIKVNPKEGIALVEWADDLKVSEKEIADIVKSAGFELKSIS